MANCLPGLDLIQGFNPTAKITSVGHNTAKFSRTPWLSPPVVTFRSGWRPFTDGALLFTHSVNITFYVLNYDDLVIFGEQITNAIQSTAGLNRRHSSTGLSKCPCCIEKEVRRNCVMMIGTGCEEILPGISAKAMIKLCQDSNQKDR